MTRVIGFAREVVAQRLLIIGAVTGVLHLVVAMHWATLSWSDDAVQQITGALDGLGALTAIFVVRRVVTPTKDPRAGDGTPLVPVTRVIAEQPGAEPHVDKHAAPDSEI